MADSTRPIFIGDPITALGHRLAGARVIVPSPDEVAKAFERALGESRLILITPELASRVPARALERALAATSPLVLVVANLGSGAAAPDLARRVRNSLGMAT